MKLYLLRVGIRIINPLFNKTEMSSMIVLQKGNYQIKKIGAGYAILMDGKIISKAETIKQALHILRRNIRLDGIQNSLDDKE